VSFAEVRTQTFDADPGWEGVNNHETPKRDVTVTEDFGWSDGKIGGQLLRTSTPAYYTLQITPQNLNNKLAAAGTISIPKSTGSSGAVLGWFNSELPGGGRPPGSIAIYIAGEKHGVRMHVRAISSKSSSDGMRIDRPPKQNGIKDKTPGIPND